MTIDTRLCDAVYLAEASRLLAQAARDLADLPPDALPEERAQKMLDNLQAARLSIAERLRQANESEDR